MAVERELKKTSPVLKEFEAMLEKDFSSRKLREKEIVKATVTEINKNFVFCDLRGKQDAIIPVEEFKSDDELSKLKIGDTIQVWLDRIETAKGEMVVSRDIARRMGAWQLFVKAFENQEEIEGELRSNSKIKGGYIFYAFDGALPLFLPSSQLSDRPLKSINHLINTKMSVLPVRCDRQRANGSVSRREVINKSKNAEIKENLKNIKEGDIIENAIVRAIPDGSWGAFLDIGNNMTALLHQSQISHNRISSVSDILSVGQKIPKVVIFKIDKETNRLSASIKLLTESPYKNIDLKFKEGEIYPAEIVKLTPYGAFCLISSDDFKVEGLCHASEMDHLNRNVDPSKVLSVSQKVSMKLLSIDKETKRISLSYKSTLENPWEKIKNKIGEEVKIKVVNILDKYIVAELVGFKVKGILHFKEISYNQNIEDLKKFNKNDIISVKILSLKDDKLRFSRKMLEKDPYLWFKQNKKGVGSVISTKVVEVLKTGVKVAVDPEKKIIVTIKKNQLAIEPADCRPEIYNVGNTMSDALIQELDLESRKITLSPKAAQQKEQESLIKKFGEGAAKSGATLRSIFSAAIGKKKKKEEK